MHPPPFIFYWNLCLSQHPAEKAPSLPLTLPARFQDWSWKSVLPLNTTEEQASSRDKVFPAGTEGSLKWFQLRWCLCKAAKGKCSSAADNPVLQVSPCRSLAVWTQGLTPALYSPVRAGLGAELPSLNSTVSPVSAEEQAGSELALGWGDKRPKWWK